MVKERIPFDQIVDRAVKTLNTVLKEWIMLRAEDRSEAKSDMFKSMIAYCRGKVK